MDKTEKRHENGVLVTGICCILLKKFSMVRWAKIENTNDKQK